MSNLVPYEPGMDFGAGVNSLNSNIKGDGVVRTEPTSPANASGSTVQYFVNRIESIEALEKELDISTEVSGKAGLGLFSASARVEFSRKVSVNRYSVFMVLKVVVQNSDRRMRDVSIKPEAIAIASEGNMERFYEMYGDSFVLGMQTGGIFLGVIEVKTTSEREREEISSEIDTKISALFGSARASNELTKNVEKFAENRSLRIICHAEGSDPTLALPENMDAMFQRARTFPSEASRFGKAYSVLLQNYKTLNLPTPPSQIDLEAKATFLREAQAQYNRLLNTLNDINFVLNNQSQFQDLDRDKVAELNDSRKVVSDSLNKLADAASRCSRYLGECRFPDINIPLIDLPERKEHPVFWKASSRKDFLGNPISESLQVASDGIGRYMDYENGSVYWSEKTGAYLTRGAIRSTWRAYGAEGGELGYPIADHSAVINNASHQDFENARIFWTPVEAPSIVMRPILTKWEVMGGLSFFGFPKTKNMSKKLAFDGLTHDFERWSIYYFPETGTFYSGGGIKDLWLKNGGLEKEGPGRPISDHSRPTEKGTSYQEFERATIHWPARIAWK